MRRTARSATDRTVAQRHPRQPTQRGASSVRGEVAASGGLGSVTSLVRCSRQRSSSAGISASMNAGELEQVVHQRVVGLRLVAAGDRGEAALDAAGAWCARGRAEGCPLGRRAARGRSRRAAPARPTRSTTRLCSSSLAAPLTAALLTPRPSAISVSDCTGGSQRRSQPEIRPVIRVPPICSCRNPNSSTSSRCSGVNSACICRRPPRSPNSKNVNYRVNGLNANRRGCGTRGVCGGSVRGGERGQPVGHGRVLPGGRRRLSAGPEPARRQSAGAGSGITVAKSSSSGS